MKNKYLVLLATGLLVGVFTSELLAKEPVQIFDGKTLSGWKVKPGDEMFWSVKDGMIVGSNNGKRVSRNTYLFTDNEYEHFEFRCKFRLTGDAKTGVINSGIQFRTQNENWEVKGYKADIGGPDGWGGIFEEGRRGKIAPADLKKVIPIVKENDWNDYLIRANGPRIQLFINGVETVNYLEKKPSIPYKGNFAIQLHKGGAATIEMKDISVIKLDGGLDPTDSKAWWAAKARMTYQELQISNIPQSPQEELKTFTVPEGFEVELVAEESKGIGKFIAVDFDSSGKMWTMTALDYPADGKKKKSKGRSLFKKGGKDKILVFDTPTAKGVQKPRVFAKNLAVPLGVMPYKNGAIAQYGPDIRFYQDTNGDGVSDKFDVILTGFGIEDSHLFPHQFTRGPGGWMYLAQGLGNFSKVVRPDGGAFTHGSKMVQYDRCRVARMQLDGSDFQYTTTGPNNVWGIVTGRDGEWFIQEANDKGYPVAKYDFGVYLNTGGTAKIKGYQPVLPPVFETAIMGGTGLSGLVLSEDIDSPFSQDGKKTFYIANPLTSSIQIVTATPLGNNRYKWEKQEDFLSSGDKWFRPVGIKFGPDGAIYVVDWYNKIIAHGEVAQNHPDRDKVRGRIWRITPKGHQHKSAPNLTQANDAELLDHISSKNALVQRLAWLEMIDRKSIDLVPDLKKYTLDTSKRLDVRLASLWACEGLGGVNDDFLNAVIGDKEDNMRAEVVRIAGRVASTSVFAAIAKSAANDTAVRVRTAVGEALVSRGEQSADTLHAAALLGKEALNGGDDLTVYEREFERFLARWAMENNPRETTAMLGDVVDLPVENRLLAMQSLKPADAALAFLPMIPKLDRDLSTTELTLITGQLSQRKVLEGFKKLLFNVDRQKSMIEALSKAEPGTSNNVLNGLLIEACRQFIKRDSGRANQALVMQLVKRHRLEAMRGDVGKWIAKASDIHIIITGLRCLRELGPVDGELCKKFTGHLDEVVQREAVISLSTAKGAEIVTDVAKYWSVLSATDKQSAITGLINSAVKAKVFSKEVLKGTFGELDNGSLEKTVIVLGDSPEAKELLKKLGASVPMIIRMTGAKGDLVDTNVSLTGRFTVEGWVRVSGKKAPSVSLLSGNKGEGISFKRGKLQVFGVASRVKSQLSSKSLITKNLWTHYAIVRDEGGMLRIYVDGVLDASSKKSFGESFRGLDLGVTQKADGTKIDFLEFRVWNIDKSEAAIREGMQVSYAEGERPTQLVKRFSGETPGLALKGRALIAPSTDAPALITAAKAEELAKMFKKYKVIVSAKGDVENGKKMFSLSCSACHMVKNEGGKLGPDLSGVGTSTDEGLLRNVLTPNAALETSYYRHDLKMKDGSLVSGFMVTEDKKSITIRLIGADDKVVQKSKIDNHSISKRSLMPEGLVSGMTDQQVADLFAYMRTLK